jgi:hypothetical protein
MLLKRKNTEHEKSNGSFVRGWTTLQRDGRDVHLIEATLTKEIIETEAQEVV